MSKSNHRVAAVAAGAAILVSLGSFGAVASGMITGTDIKDGSIQKADIGKNAVGAGEIKPGSVKMSDLSDNAVQGMQGEQGPKGETGSAGPAGKDGAQGPQGPKGDAGKNGVSGYEVVTYDYALVSGGGIATVACPEGKVALGGGYRLKDAAALTNGTAVVASFPGRMDWDTNQPKVDRNDGWIIQVNKPANVNPGAMTVYATCATMN